MGKGRILVDAAITIAVYVAVFWLIGPESLFFALEGANLLFLALAILAYCAMNLLMSLRVSAILGKMGYKIGARQILPSHLAGMLASDFTPARAGYFFTAFSLSQRFKLRIEKTLLAILCPQLLDFLIKVVSAAALAIFAFGPLLPGHPIIHASIILAFLAGVLSAALLIFHPSALSLLSFLKAAPYAKQIFLLLHRIRAHSGALYYLKWKIAAITLLSWLAKGAEWLFISYSLGISIYGNVFQDFAFMMLFQAAITLLQFIPLPTIAGAGATEAAFAALLLPLGVAPAKGVAFGLLTRIVVLPIDSFGFPLLSSSIKSKGFNKEIRRVTGFD
jgi:uncharacterized protein (TIRG00374 family)